MGSLLGKTGWETNDDGCADVTWRSLPHEQIGRAGVAYGRVGLVAVDPFRAAVFAARADEQHPAVARERERASEFVSGARVRRLDVRMLRPRRAAAGEQIDRAGFRGRVVVL